MWCYVVDTKRRRLGHTPTLLAVVQRLRQTSFRVRPHPALPLPASPTSPMAPSEACPSSPLSSRQLPFSLPTSVCMFSLVLGLWTGFFFRVTGFWPEHSPHRGGGQEEIIKEWRRLRKFLSIFFFKGCDLFLDSGAPPPPKAGGWRLAFLKK